jgi:uncharacterized protein YjgD (DUF1641 family)
MNESDIHARLDAIESKLDRITEYIEIERRRQREREELKNDLAMIGKDLFQSAVVELEEVAGHFDSKDLLSLIKKLLRNTRNLNRMLDQMSSTADFIEDVRPIGKQIFQELLETLNELDRKGYFAFFRELGNILDTVVTSYSAEDLRQLRLNIVAILNTVKSVTQPDMLHSMNNAVGIFRKMDIPVDKNISLLTLLRQMNDPEVRRGIYFLLQFAKNIAGSPANGSPSTIAITPHQEK